MTDYAQFMTYDRRMNLVPVIAEKKKDAKITSISISDSVFEYLIPDKFKISIN